MNAKRLNLAPPIAAFERDRARALAAEDEAWVFAYAEALRARRSPEAAARPPAHYLKQGPRPAPRAEPLPSGGAFLDRPADVDALFDDPKINRDEDRLARELADARHRGWRRRLRAAAKEVG